MDLKDSAITYWREASTQDFRAAEALFARRLYPQCLFFCHLSLEKLLKALVLAKTREYPPYIHDLRRLAELAHLAPTEQQQRALDEISTFNIAGRYPDQRFQFYKQYNRRAAADRYFQITEELRLWSNKEFQRK